MKILVTGSNGFIGWHLLPALLKLGHHLVLPLRPGAILPVIPEAYADRVARIEISDLATADYDSLCQGIDAIVHLAAIAHTHSTHSADLYYQINYKLAVDLGRAAVRSGVKRFVFMSSIRAQTGIFSDHVLSEQDDPCPIDEYGRCKLAAERDLSVLTGIDVVSLRPVVVYGEGAKGNVGLLRSVLKRGVPLPSAGITAKRSYVSIRRLISAIVFVLENPEPLSGPFIVTDPQPRTLAEFAHQLAKEGLDGSRMPSMRAIEPRLFFVPEVLLRWMISLVDPHFWQRLGENQVASSYRLHQAGWTDEYLSSLHK